jgi:hypothetical protein
VPSGDDGLEVTGWQDGKMLGQSVVPAALWEAIVEGSEPSFN